MDVANPPKDVTITTDDGTYVSLAWLRSTAAPRPVEPSTAERVDAIKRYGDPVTQDQRARATTLLDAMLAAAAAHGASLDDFDWCSDLPGACVDVITALDRKAAR